MRLCTVDKGFPQGILPARTVSARSSMFDFSIDPIDRAATAQLIAHVRGSSLLYFVVAFSSAFRRERIERLFRFLSLGEAEERFDSAHLRE